MQKFLWLTFTLAIAFSCTPVQESAEECESSETYSPVLRRCIDTSLISDNSPVAAPNQNYTFNEDTTANSIVVNPGTDADGDDLSYEIASPPQYGTLSNCMDLSGSTAPDDLSCSYTPNPNFWGTDSFSYRISDGSYYSSTSSIFITVNNITNDIPWIPSFSFSVPAVQDVAITDPQIRFGDYDYDFTGSTYVATGFEGYNFSFGPSHNCGGWLNMNTSTGSLSGTPTNADVGACTVGVRVTDPWGNPISAETTTNLFVSNVNDAPTISSFSPPTFVTEGSNYSYTVNGSDPDVGDTFTYLLGLGHDCTFLTLDSISGLFDGTPDNTHVGDCTLSVYLEDSYGEESDIYSTTITVQNRAPSFTSTASATGPEKSTLSLSDPEIQVDEEGLGGQYNIDNGTTTCDLLGISGFNQTTGAFNYAPLDSQFSGTCQLGLIFNDGNTGTASTIVELTFTEVNDPPIFLGLATATTINYGAPAFTLDFKVDEGGYLDREDNQQLYLSVSTDNPTLIPLNGIELSSTGTSTTVSITATASLAVDNPGNDDASAYDVSATISPAGGLAGSATLTFAVYDGTATTTQNVDITVKDVFAVHKGWKKIQANGKKIDHAGTEVSPLTVNLEWSDMDTYTASTLTAESGWNVFRRKTSDTQFNFNAPLNSSPLASDTYTFTETSNSSPANSNDPIEPGEAYVYTVLPVDGDDANIYIVSGTKTATIRVVAPPDNMSLVHRLMANQSMCQSLGLTPDPVNHNRCAYTGPGTTGGFYDIGADFLMTTHETGCNYTSYSESGCGSTNGCIGTTDPGPGIGSNGDFYYNRSTGVCLAKDAGTWNPINNNLTSIPLGSLRDLQRAQLAPLTNINQQNASYYCSNLTRYYDNISASTETVENIIIAASTTPTVSSRLQYIAANTWDPTLTASATLEAGGDLSLNSLCNSSASNGLIYFDTEVPGPSFLDTLPFTDTATYRSVRTGSDATNNCKSLFGIQDLVGNVREWNLETLDCSGATCSLNSDPFNIFNGSYTATATTFYYNDANFFYAHLPVGTATTATTSILTSNAIFNGDGGKYDGASSANTAFVAGGSFDDSDPSNSAGARAGRWSYDLIDATSTASDIGFRCTIWLD